MIIRTEKTGNFTAISNVAFNDAQLSLKAKGIYGFLMTKPNNWHITVRGLESQLLEGKASIAAALAELESAGYIARTTGRSHGGKFSPAECILYEEPRPGYRDADNRYPGNQPQVNTNRVNTEVVKTDEEIVSSKQSVEPLLREDKRDPEVTELVEYFEAAMGFKMPRMQYQRRAAKNLIQKWTLPITLRAIDAAVACRDRKYAPRILSLEDLRDKWNKLTDFYRRTGADAKKKQDSADEIKKITGVE